MDCFAKRTPEHVTPRNYGTGMSWSLILVACSHIVVVLIARRVLRYQRDIDGGFKREYRPPPFHDRAGPH